jgi:hypothetical protein
MMSMGSSSKFKRARLALDALTEDLLMMRFLPLCEIKPFPAMASRRMIVVGDQSVGPSSQDSIVGWVTIT